jgi:U3 small nucleolar RNA-associated protein 25
MGKRKSVLTQARKMLQKIQKVEPLDEPTGEDEPVIEELIQVNESEEDYESTSDTEETEQDVYHYLFGNKLIKKDLEPVASAWNDKIKIELTDTIKPTLLKERLKEPFRLLNKKEMSEDQKEIWNHMSQYHDILMTFPHKELRNLYTLHAMNHVYKTRDRILKNKEKLKKDAEVEVRDQGFTRPKVLILVPFKNDCFEIVQNLIKLSDTKTQENKARFVQEFQGDMEPDPKKPQDYNETFKGNVDDCFKIGLQFSRKTMKLYAPFYSSDIIIASPLGLALIIGQKGYSLLTRDKKRDFDYLSSIEMVIMDHSDIFLMQNWDHVQVI